MVHANTGRILAEKTNDKQIFKNRRRKNAPKHKKQVRIQMNSERPEGVLEADAITHCNTDGDFTEVRNKRKTKNHRTNVTSDVTSGGEMDASVNCKSQKQAKINKITELKNMEPQKVFIIEVKDDNVDSIRKTIWPDIVKKMGAPKIARKTVIQKEESKIINIVAEDDVTYEALKTITEERADVQLKPSKLPRIMIYDGDKTLTPDEISRNVLAQNTTQT